MTYSAIFDVVTMIIALVALVVALAAFYRVSCLHAVPTEDMEDLIDTHIRAQVREQQRLAVALEYGAFTRLKPGTRGLTKQ